MSQAKNTERAAGLRRFKPYPAYTDSGVEWLGEIPASWVVLALKRLIDAERPITYGIVQCGPDVSPHGIPYIRPVDMHDEAGVDPANLQHTTVEIAAPYARSTVKGGDIVVSIGPSFGKAMMVPSELTGANLTQGTARIATGPGLHNRFLFWCLRSAYTPSFWEAGCEGATFRALTLWRLGLTPISLPPIHEQRAIATFLDCETAKIDAMVVKKERLIELLQEKRVALITRAVTKGLDPAAPMKESGVEWLGEVPAHWRGMPLKRWVAIKITDGPHETPEILPDGVPFISAEAVQDGRINFELKRGYISEELHRQYCRKCRPKREDLFLCKSGATTGKLAIVDTDEEFSVWSPLAQIRANTQIAMPRFLFHALQAEYIQDQIRRGWSAGTQPNIGMGIIEMIFVVAPPLEEQRVIVSVIDRETAKIDTLIAKVREGIEKLKEYRTALISAAVTGKIDVREAIRA